MAIDNEFIPDVDAILSHRYDNGADFWTTPDKRLLKGSPFSTYNSARMLLELGMSPSDPILEKVSALFFSVWKEDGRFKLIPKRRHTALPHSACGIVVMPYGVSI